MPLPTRRRRSSPDSRRGNVALMSAGAAVTLMAFGALAIDAAYLRLAQAQAQDVADAASVAALWALRESGDADAAEVAADRVVALNPVVGRPAELASLVFGDWDSSDQTFTEDGDSPNAASATLQRSGAGAVQLFLARLFGRDSADVAAAATSASRNLQVVLVMDITNSWTRPNFYNARAAAVAFYDVLAAAHGPFDEIGMVVFTGRYAWEFTPLTLLDDPGGIRADWAAMETASKAGVPKSNPNGCQVHGGSNTNNFASPAGGCFPNMPREYLDEPGTDHTTGLQMARQMFEAADDAGAYRVMVVLTDGYPNGLSGSNFKARGLAGYTETRWDEYVGPIPRTNLQITSGSVALAEEMWEELEVHTWVVSFVASGAFMEDMAQGDGYYTVTNSSTALVGIFTEIANSLPLAVVQ